MNKLIVSIEIEALRPKSPIPKGQVGGQIPILQGVNNRA
jgi:hypothetical protein